MHKRIIVMAALAIAAARSVGAEEVTCEATLTTLQLQRQYGVKLDNPPAQKFTVTPTSAPKGTFTFANNLEAKFQTFLARGSSRQRPGGGILSMKVLLQRRHANGTVTVLAAGGGNSDMIDDPAALKDTRAMGASVTLENPEIYTAIVNSGLDVSRSEALKLGIVPDGVVSDLFVNCVVRTAL